MYTKVDIKSANRMFFSPLFFFLQPLTAVQIIDTCRFVRDLDIWIDNTGNEGILKQNLY